MAGSRNKSVEVRKVSSVFGIGDDRYRTVSDLGLDGTGARRLKKKVQAFNDGYGVEGQVQYILSDQRGYMLTTSLPDIQDAINRDFRIASEKMKRLRKRKTNLEKVLRDVPEIEQARLFEQHEEEKKSTGGKKR